MRNSVIAASVMAIATAGAIFVSIALLKLLDIIMLVAMVAAQ